MIALSRAFQTSLTILAACCSLPLHAQIHVHGHVTWTDRRGPSESGSAHPARNVLVEICDTRLSAAAQVLATTYTSESGTYAATVPTSPGSQRDILIRARAQSPAGTVHAIGTNLSYILPSETFSAQSVNADVTADIAGNFVKTNNAAFSVLDALLGARQYVSKVSHTDLAPIPVEFPTSGTVSYFQYDQLHILLGDRWDWDVIMHEYGHYVSKTFALDDSPGGTHYLNENISDRLPKSSAIRLAWGEGWPTYFAIIAQKEMGMASLGIPYVGDSIYSDTEDTEIDIDLAGNDGSMGEDNEVSIMRLLFQSVTDFPDTHLSAAELWKALTSSTPPNLSPAYSAMIANLDIRNVLSIGIIATRHRIAPGPSQPGAVTALPDTPPQFVWVANGGGQRFHNNRFTIRFLNRDYKIILESPAITSGTSFQPTADQWDLLRAGDVFYWAVAGSGSEDPGTGPYVSSVLNLLPLATPGGGQD